MPHRPSNTDFGQNLLLSCDLSYNLFSPFIWKYDSLLSSSFLCFDTFQFSKATGRIKETISNLPGATEDDDGEEAAALKEKTEAVNEEVQTDNKEESDPFGLDDLIPSTSKKDDRSKGKRVTPTKARKGQEETKRFLRSQREALISCLEIAANRYKTPWSSIY